MFEKISGKIKKNSLTRLYKEYSDLWSIPLTENEGEHMVKKLFDSNTIISILSANTEKKKTIILKNGYTKTLQGNIKITEIPVSDYIQISTETYDLIIDPTEIIAVEIK